jgi:hypothetical protein
MGQIVIDTKLLAQGLTEEVLKSALKITEQEIQNHHLEIRLVSTPKKKKKPFCSMQIFLDKSPHGVVVGMAGYKESGILSTIESLRSGSPKGVWPKGVSLIPWLERGGNQPYTKKKLPLSPEPIFNLQRGGNQPYTKKKLRKEPLSQEHIFPLSLRRIATFCHYLHHQAGFSQLRPYWESHLTELPLQQQTVVANLLKTLCAYSRLQELNLSQIAANAMYQDTTTVLIYRVEKK